MSYLVGSIKSGTKMAAEPCIHLANAESALTRARTLCRCKPRPFSILLFLQTLRAILLYKLSTCGMS